MRTEKQQTSDRNGANLEDMPKDVAKAYRYHLRGLTGKEISLLCSVSHRTVQRWKIQYSFEQLAATPPPEMETIQQKAAKLAAAGLSYSQIGRKLKRCKATIYNYIRAAKETGTQASVSAEQAHRHQQPEYRHQ